MPTINASPRIVSNGLVFYYDSMNYAKSWRGPPTTNTVSSGFNSIHTNWNNSGTATWSSNDTTVPRVFDNLPVLSMYKDTAGNSHIANGYSTLTAGATHAVSTYAYIPSNAGTIAGSVPCMRTFPANTSRGALAFQGNTDWNTWPRDRWIRITGTFTNSANDTEMYISCYLDNAGNSIYLTAPMVEVGSFVTPFITPGTSRSSTQAILDLTNNNTITVSNLTFNSDGTFSFDGVDDNINCGNGSSINFGTGSFTVSAWFKRYANATTNLRLLSKAAGSDTADAANAGFCFFGSNTGISFGVNPTAARTIIGAANYSLNEWVNVVGLVERGVSMRTYKNASQVATAAAPTGSVSGTTSLFIGDNYGTGLRWQGEIPVVKIYNRALSVSEIQQNFNALRGRYGL